MRQPPAQPQNGRHRAAVIVAKSLGLCGLATGSLVRGEFVRTLSHLQIVGIVLVLPNKLQESRLSSDASQAVNRTIAPRYVPADGRKYAHFRPLSRLHLVEMHALLNAGRV